MTFIYACATVSVLIVLAAVGVSVWSAVRVCRGAAGLLVEKA